MKRIRTIVVLVLAVSVFCAIPALGPVDFGPASARAAAVNVAFKCDANPLIRPIDPLISFNVEPSAHTHSISGDPDLRKDTTLAELMARPGGCDFPQDKTVFWDPSIRSPITGQFVAPLQATFTMRNETHDTATPPDVTVPPDGLGFVADAGAGALWACSSAPGAQTHTIPASCPAGDLLLLASYFSYEKPCWDGVNPGPGFGRSTGPANGRDHVLKAVNGVCSAPNKRLPGLSWHFKFPNSAVGGRLSSDSATQAPGASLHFDHVFGGQYFLQRVVSMCLNGTGVTGTAPVTTCVKRSDGKFYRKSDNAVVIDPAVGG